MSLRALDVDRDVSTAYSHQSIIVILMVTRNQSTSSPHEY